MFALRLLFQDFIGSLLYFPIWWYSSGLIALWNWILQAMHYRWRAYALSLWLHNLFTPMYGEYEWSGRLISFVVRISVITARLIAYVVEWLVYLAGVLIWLLSLPVLSVLLAYDFIY